MSKNSDARVYTAVMFRYLDYNGDLVQDKILYGSDVPFEDNARYNGKKYTRIMRYTDIDEEGHVTTLHIYNQKTNEQTFAGRPEGDGYAD